MLLVISTKIKILIVRVNNITEIPTNFCPPFSSSDRRILKDSINSNISSEVYDKYRDFLANPVKCKFNALVDKAENTFPTAIEIITETVS